MLSGVVSVKGMNCDEGSYPDFPTKSENIGGGSPTQRLWMKSLSFVYFCVWSSFW